MHALGSHLHNLDKPPYEDTNFNASNWRLDVLDALYPVCESVRVIYHLLMVAGVDVRLVAHAAGQLVFATPDDQI